jgi:hypothetical protein
MSQISLKEFLITGTFGPIELGATRQQLIDILGKPQRWGTQKDQASAEIWRYSWIEFYFPHGGDGLYMILCDHLDWLESRARFDLDLWILSNQLTLAAFETAMNDQQISFTKTHDQKWGLTDIELQSGVTLTFEAFHENDETPYLLVFKKYIEPQTASS